MPISSRRPRRELILCEGAPGVRAGLAARFAGHAKIRVAGAGRPRRSARAFARSHRAAFGRAISHAAEADALFAQFHRLLKSDGVLVVSDIIPPQVPAATDAWRCCGSARRNGFFFAAFFGLVRTLLSDYWRIRSRFGLTRYAEAAMIEKLAAAGFAAAAIRPISAITRRAWRFPPDRDEPATPPIYHLTVFRFGPPDAAALV